VTWSSWLVSKRVQLSVESQLVKRWPGGYYEIAASLVPSWLSCQLTRALHGRLRREDLSAGSWRISLGRSRCQKTAGRGCVRVRTLVCVCQWSINCIFEWWIQVVNKSTHPIHTPSIVTIYLWLYSPLLDLGRSSIPSSFTHNRQDSLDGEPARRKAATCK
jgi:hypothetical protein